MGQIMNFLIFIEYLINQLSNAIARAFAVRTHKLIAKFKAPCPLGIRITTHALAQLWSLDA